MTYSISVWTYHTVSPSNLTLHQVSALLERLGHPSAFDAAALGQVVEEFGFCSCDPLFPSLLSFKKFVVLLTWAPWVGVLKPQHGLCSLLLQSQTKPESVREIGRTRECRFGGSVLAIAEGAKPTKIPNRNEA